MYKFLNNTNINFNTVENLFFAINLLVINIFIMIFRLFC